MSRFHSIIATALAILFAAPAGAEIATLLRQGDLLDAQRRTAEALAVYRQAEQHEPQRAGLLHRISKQLGESIQESVDPGRRRALATEALSYARRAVAADPADSSAQVAVAICLGLMMPYQGNKEKIAATKLIESHARRALELDPRNELAHYVLGAWHSGLSSLNPVLAGVARIVYGRLPPASNDEAIRSFQRALDLNPDRAASWLGMGNALANSDRPAEARRALEQAVALPVRYKDDEATKAAARRALAELD